MTGLVGGESERIAKSIRDAMPTEGWTEWENATDGDGRIGLAYHADTDPDGTAHWQSGSRHLLCYGVVSNLEEVAFSSTELVEKLFDSPEETLSRLDGPFALAGMDTDQDSLLAATDRIGSRPVYYSTEDRFGFCSHTGPLSEITDAELDSQSLSDMLLLDSVWGDKTLLKSVKSLRPGHVLQYRDGDVELARYWHPQCDTSSKEFYGQKVFREYRDSMTNVADTVSGETGLWLSGGLDSRMMGTVLAEYGVFPTAFTYDRPVDYRKIIGRSDVDLAPEVATGLGLDHRTVAHSPSEMTEYLSRAVKLVDGMIAWPPLLGLAASFKLPRSELDVVFEGSGHSEFLGEGLWRYHLDADNYSRPESAIVARHGRREPSEVASYLSADIDPLATLTDEVSRSEQDAFGATVMDVNVRNLFSRYQLLSNKIPRSLFGTRHPFADGDFLQTLTHLPADLSMPTVPLTNGEIPWGYSPLKLDLSRRLGRSMTRLPYERTGLPPWVPNRLHGVGYVLQESVNRIVSDPPFHQWIRESEAFRDWLAAYTKRSRNRPAWSEDTVDELVADVRDGSGQFGTAAAIASVEIWCDEYDI